MVILLHSYDFKATHKYLSYNAQPRQSVNLYLFESARMAPELFGKKPDDLIFSVASRGAARTTLVEDKAIFRLAPWGSGYASRRLQRSAHQQRPFPHCRQTRLALQTIEFRRIRPQGAMHYGFGIVAAVIWAGRSASVFDELPAGAF
jgi:hypothetical protein